MVVPQTQPDNAVPISKVGDGLGVFRQQLQTRAHTQVELTDAVFPAGLDAPHRLDVIVVVLGFYAGDKSVLEVVHQSSNLPAKEGLTAADQFALSAGDVHGAYRARRQLNFPVPGAACSGVGGNEFLGGLAVAAVKMGLREVKGQVGPGGIRDMHGAIA